MQQSEVACREKTEKTLRIELTIAYLLRWGVLISFVVLGLGTGALIITGSTGYPTTGLEDVDSLVRYTARPGFPVTVEEALSGLSSLKPYAVITLGVLVLIAIPVLRVAVSIIAFALEGDRLFVLITTFVLIVLLVSFLIGEAGG